MDSYATSSDSSLSNCNVSDNKLICQVNDSAEEDIRVILKRDGYTDVEKIIEVEDSSDPPDPPDPPVTTLEDAELHCQDSVTEGGTFACSLLCNNPNVTSEVTEWSFTPDPNSCNESSGTHSKTCDVPEGFSGSRVQVRATAEGCNAAVAEVKVVEQAIAVVTCQENAIEERLFTCQVSCENETSDSNSVVWTSDPADLGGDVSEVLNHSFKFDEPLAATIRAKVDGCKEGVASVVVKEKPVAEVVCQEPAFVNDPFVCEAQCEAVLMGTQWSIAPDSALSE